MHRCPRPWVLQLRLGPAESARDDAMTAARNAGGLCPVLLCASRLRDWFRCVSGVHRKEETIERSNGTGAFAACLRV